MWVSYHAPKLAPNPLDGVARVGQYVAQSVNEGQDVDEQSIWTFKVVSVDERSRPPDRLDDGFKLNLEVDLVRADRGEGGFKFVFCLARRRIHTSGTVDRLGSPGCGVS